LENQIGNSKGPSSVQGPYRDIRPIYRNGPYRTERKLLHHIDMSLCFFFAREKMDTVASRMENVAKNAIRVLAENVKNPKDSALSREAPSILCLRLHNSNKSKAGWDDFGSTDPPNSHALCIHLSERDRRICLRNQDGSTIFSLPACSMLVTIGKQVQVSCYTHHSFLSILKTTKMIILTHTR
jgi:hypothetical protein